jgi:hypothetical protein
MILTATDPHIKDDVPIQIVQTSLQCNCFRTAFPCKQFVQLIVPFVLTVKRMTAQPAYTFTLGTYDYKVVGILQQEPKLMHRTSNVVYLVARLTVSPWPVGVAHDHNIHSTAWGQNGWN